VYLNAEQRRQALALSRTVRHMEEMVGRGGRKAKGLIEAARAVFATELAIRVDYIALIDWATLLPLEAAAPGALFAVAAWVGETLLIDNTVFS
jgi:pantoate--beta-alanine ligase